MKLRVRSTKINIANRNQLRPFSSSIANAMQRPIMTACKNCLFLNTLHSENRKLLKKIKIAVDVFIRFILAIIFYVYKKHIKISYALG